VISIPKSAAAVIALALLAAGAAAETRGGDRQRLEWLPGAYRSHPLLIGAQALSIMMLRPESAQVSAAAGTGAVIQYLIAHYADRSRALEDMDEMLSAELGGAGSWHIVLQTRREVHWLSGECELAQERLRGIYSGALEEVESRGHRVENAVLCPCSAWCRRIAVDR
jgi:hypothetical protein